MNSKIKKISAGILCAAILGSAVFMLASCGKSNNPAQSSDVPSQSDTAGTKEPDEIILGYGRNDAGLVINPLSGLAGTDEMTKNRPVAIMINNIHLAMPQVGISHADIVYECMAEGGITRLMMVTSDYKSIGTIGSVRSSRGYYIDYAQGHDAIYVHAGGSSEAYTQMRLRKIDHIDGVNPVNGINLTKDYYYNDPDRLKTMSREHTLMTTGSKIEAAIERLGYRTAISDNAVNAFNFRDYREESVASGTTDASKISIPYNTYHSPYFVYDSAKKVYTRYQFKGTLQIDGETGNALEFKNIIVISCTHTSTNDSYLHIDIDTTGSGEGYYISDGKCEKITWHKDSRDSEVTYTNEKGEPLYINCGKTFVNVVSPLVFSRMTIE